MTQNQIAYWSAQESKRANMAREGENVRHNLEVEAQGRSTIAENIRHNLFGEGETLRHNQATESIQQQDISERGRHNRVTELETQRHNISTESIGQLEASVHASAQREAERHNKEEERISYIVPTYSGVTSSAVKGLTGLLGGKRSKATPKQPQPDFHWLDEASGGAKAIGRGSAILSGLTTALTPIAGLGRFVEAENHPIERKEE